MRRQFVDEAKVVARAAGQPMRNALGDEVMAKLASMPPGFRAPMAEDLDRCRGLVLDWVSGVVHLLGQQFGVPTHAHCTAYRALALHKDGRAHSHLNLARQ